MMNPTKDFLTFTVPLTLEAHRIAQEFHKQQSNSKKAKQVYLNTLAVYAVNFYLQCLGIETDLEASNSWNPIMQSLANIADLEVKNLGKLECRAVLPEANVCYVPPEVLDARIGYVAVRLDQSLTEAMLLGFLPAVATEEVPLNQLKSLEDLLEHLSQLAERPVAAINVVKEPIQLSQWLQNLINQGWETMEALLAPPQAELAFRFRKPVDGVKRGKLLNLERVDENVALFIGLHPSADSEMDISVEVYPSGGQIYLPQDLQLMVLDEKGEAVMQAQARSTKNIQLKFSGELGESFGVKVAWGNVSVTEAFVI
jgi:hypothetical protein